MRNYRKSRLAKKSAPGSGSKLTQSSLPVCGGRFQVPWVIYHGVPVGWTKAVMVEVHRRLGGVYPIECCFRAARGIREPTDDQVIWYEYKSTLYRVADGILVGDRACIELAIRYIELRWIGSYSGYIRALLARRLKHVDLGKSEQRRLIRHFEYIVANRDYTAEFREYEKLWKRITIS